MGNAYIEIENIVKSFGTARALKGVSLSVEKGSFVTLLGPSGCGKTTLLRTLAGFYTQDAGRISIAGKSMDGVPADQRNTPLVFQDYALFPHMTIEENIGYGLKLQRLPKAEIKRRVAEQLEIFNLSGLGKRLPRELSGGQQQRAAFARALILGYDILLLDEPLSNLDAKLRVEVRDELRRIQRRTGMTVLYVTHDQEEALAMSDRIAVMNKGEIVQLGTPQEIYFAPDSRFVADFIGAVNLLPVTFHGSSGGQYEVEVLGLQGKSVVGPADGESFAVLRPERIFLCAPQESPLAGEITDSVFLGRLVRYRVKAAGQTLLVEALSDEKPLAPGTAVGIRFDRDRLHIITGGKTI